MWHDLIAIIRSEAGPEVAGRIETEVRFRLGGARLTIPAVGRAPPVTEDAIRQALASHKWHVADAARALGVHHSTVYRVLSRRRQAQVQVPDPGPQLAGRMVR